MGVPERFQGVKALHAIFFARSARLGSVLPCCTCRAGISQGVHCHSASTGMHAPDRRGVPHAQSAVAVMHAAGVVDADLKPENVLLRAPAGQAPGSCPEVVLCDLGSAFSETETDTAKLSFEMQTLPYRAPEVRLAHPSRWVWHLP